MNNTFGDFEAIANSIAEGADGGMFPIIDPPLDENGDVQTNTLNDKKDNSKGSGKSSKEDKYTGGFKDERTVVDDNKKPVDTIVSEEEEETLEGTGEDNSEGLFSESEEDNLDTSKSDTDKKKHEQNDSEDESGNNDVSSDSISDIFGEIEPDVAAVVQEQLFDELGFEFEEGEEKAKTVKEVVDYMKKVVEENSTPQFANDEVSKLNEYVANGGKIEKYFENIYSDGLDVDSLDLENESHQRAVYKEALKLQGYNQDRIDKKLQRAEETGILQEEAEDSQEFVKKYRDENSEKLLEEQKKVREVAEKRQQKFYEDVISNIEGRKDVFGSKLSTADKKKAVDYIFRVEKDGTTKFQKETMNPEDFAEVALIRMKKDSLIKNLTRTAESQAAKNLRDKLKTKTKFGKTSEEDTSSSSSESPLSVFSKMSFQKPN